MMVAQSLAHGSLRAGLILLLSGLVVFTTYILTPLTPNESAQRTPAPNSSDIPGSEVVLRLAIGEIRTHRMSEATSDTVRQKLPQIEQILARLGPIQSLTYLGSDARGDNYRASFKNGSLIWNISLGRGGVIDDLRVRATEGRKPQDWINNYALVPAGAGVFVGDLVKLLLLIGVGRFVRIRL